MNYIIGKIYIVNGWPKVCTHIYNGIPHFGLGNWGKDWKIEEATDDLLNEHAKQVCAVNSKETVMLIWCAALPEIAPYYERQLLLIS